MTLSTVGESQDVSTQNNPVNAAPAEGTMGGRTVTRVPNDDAPIGNVENPQPCCQPTPEKLQALSEAALRQRAPSGRSCPACGLG